MIPASDYGGLVVQTLALIAVACLGLTAVFGLVLAAVLRQWWPLYYFLPVWAALIVAAFYAFG